MELALAILGAVITTASLLYTIKTNQEKKSWERLVREKLAGLAGNIEVIRQNGRCLRVKQKKRRWRISKMLSENISPQWMSW